jgi:hypothetical protein
VGSTLDGAADVVLAGVGDGLSESGVHSVLLWFESTL